MVRTLFLTYQLRQTCSFWLSHRVLELSCGLSPPLWVKVAKNRYWWSEIWLKAEAGRHPPENAMANRKWELVGRLREMEKNLQAMREY